MVRFSLVIVLYLFLILKVCRAVESTVSKRTQKCQGYSAHVFGQGVRPTCDTTTGNKQANEIQGFPHIASLGIRFHSEEHYRWDCHGTLVSSRYILSIAYCLRNSRFTLAKVRLGATSTNYSDESISTDYDVEEIILHPLYKPSSYYNNVGLIKLSRKVEFSESVRPICLPDSDLKPSTLYQVNYESTERKNPVQRPLSKYKYTYNSNEGCNETVTSISYLSRKLHDGITDELLCIVRQTKISADYSCIGESGAPLYIDHSQVACSHLQMGIALFKIICGNEDVATKVL